MVFIFPINIFYMIFFVIVDKAEGGIHCVAANRNFNDFGYVTSVVDPVIPRLPLNISYI